jgi:hypothetical protein
VVSFLYELRQYDFSSYSLLHNCNHKLSIDEVSFLHELHHPFFTSVFLRFGHLSFINQFSKKITKTGLNSLQQKGYQISVKNWIFEDPIHNKGPVLVILVAWTITQSGSGSFVLEKRAVETVEASEFAENIEANEATEVSKA